MANQRFYTANKLVEVIDIYIYIYTSLRKAKSVKLSHSLETCVMSSISASVETLQEH